MEALIKEHGFEVPPFANGRRKNGKKKAQSIRKSVTICWDGTSQITVQEILTK